MSKLIDENEKIKKTARYETHMLAKESANLVFAIGCKIRVGDSIKHLALDIYNR